MMQRLLKEILEKDGVKRYQIWKKLGINQGQFSSFLKGEKGFSLKKLELIVDFLGYEILLSKKSKIGRNIGAGLNNQQSSANSRDRATLPEPETLNDRNGSFPIFDPAGKAVFKKEDLAGDGDAMTSYRSQDLRVS